MESKNFKNNNYNNNQYSGMIKMEFCPYCNRLIKNNIFDQHIATHIQNFNSNNNNNQNYSEINTNKKPEGNYINCSDEPYEYPSLSEIQNSNNESVINNYPTLSTLNNISSENNNHINNDTDENIKINIPNRIVTFSNTKSFSKNINNINSINIIQKNNNNISNKNNNHEPQLTKINSNTYKIGNDEFEDLTDEANDIKNKQLEEEAYKKKILGIADSKNDDIYIEKKDISIGEKIGNFIEDHAESIMTVIDIVGCVLLNGPSIVRTYVRIENLITGNRNDSDNENIEDDGGEPNNISELENKEKDLETILKFLPIYELKEKQKCNNNCIICLSEFEVGDKISTIPCFHVFHTKCIQEWLENNLSCPICKYEIRLSSFIGNKYN